MADFFTKPLSGDTSYRLRNAIMNHPPRSDSAALALQSRMRATKRVRYVRVLCWGHVGHIKDPACVNCDGRGYDTVRVHVPAVPSAGGCREP
eukprot:40217-Prymnesium_polylepis.1